MRRKWSGYVIDNKRQRRLVSMATTGARIFQIHQIQLYSYIKSCIASDTHGLTYAYLIYRIATPPIGTPKRKIRIWDWVLIRIIMNHDSGFTIA